MGMYQIVLTQRSMIEAYTTEEDIEFGGPFYNKWLKDQIAIGLSPSRHKGKLYEKGQMGRKSFIPKDYNTVLEAHHNILHQLSIMEPIDRATQEWASRTKQWAHRRLGHEGAQAYVHDMVVGSEHSRWENNGGKNHQEAGIWTITPDHYMADVWH